MTSRRQLLVALGAGALTASRLAAAQKDSQLPLIGYLGSSSPIKAWLEGLRQGLKESGYVDGQNATLELHWVDGKYERLPAIAADLVSRKAALIFAGGLPSTIAAKAATTAIPIVFVVGADPVKLGVVASLNQPGGNITGISQFFGVLGAKRLELLHELVPTATTIAVVSNPKNPNADDHLREIKEAARALKKRIEVFTASSGEEVDAAFMLMAQKRVEALLVADDPLFNTRSKQFTGLAARHKLPAMFYLAQFVSDGGLLSYGSDNADNYRLGGVYAGRILKGAKPADLPVLQPTKFELVINLKTAKALGIKFPDTILLRADKVIK